MEIKDTNNVVNQFLAFRNNAAGAAGEALGAGFASFMAQTTEAFAGGKESGAVKTAVNERAERTADASKAAEPAEDKKVKASKKNRPADKVETSPAKKTERKEVAPEKADAAVVQNVSESKPEQPAAVAAEAPVVETNEAQTAEAPVLQVDTTREPRVTELKISSVGADSAPDFAAVMSGNTVSLLSQDIDLQALASLKKINVLDSASGEVVSMSGAEFAAKLQQASDAGELFVYGAVTGQFVEQIPLTIEMPVAEEKVKTASVSDFGAETVAYDDPALVEQALALDEKVGMKDKLKVSVDVKEEKIAASSSQELVKDAISLQEVAETPLKNEKTAVASQDKAVAASSSQSQPVAQNGISGQTDMSVPVAAVINPAATVQDNVASEVASKIASISETGGNIASHASIGGSEAVASARAETASRSGDTSFRDIYKGMSKEVVDQVKVNITKSAVRGVDKIDIQLKPEDLGHIEIKMQISKDGKLQAHIISSRPETMEILQKEMQNLEKAFNEAGFQTDDNSLSFSFREDAQTGGQDRNAELRNFIGSVLEHENSEEFANNDNLLYWDPAKGLNIRV